MPFGCSGVARHGLAYREILDDAFVGRCLEFVHDECRHCVGRRGCHVGHALEGVGGCEIEGALGRRLAQLRLQDDILRLEFAFVHGGLCAGFK